MKFGKMPIVLAATLASMTIATAQSSGTEPQDKGNTGWTGGSGYQPTQENGGGTTGQNTVHDEDRAKTQPVEASGQDLKGPPQQLPPSKTPE